MLPPSRPRSDLYALGCVVLLVALHVTALELKEPRYFLRDDNAAYFLPVYVHTAGTLFRTGEPALLNYHQYLGQTHLASGQTAVLYPPVYVAYGLATWLWGDARGVIFLLILGHLAMGAAGFFVLLRTWSVDRLVAVPAAILWATFPFLTVVSRNWVWVAYAAAWVPWSLVFLDAWLSRGMRWGLAAYAVAKALFCFQGYAQYVILGTLFEGVFVLLRTFTGHRRRSPGWWRRVAGLGGALAASGALAAPLLLPMWKAKQESQARAGGLPLEEFLSNPLGVAVFLRAQVFDIADRAIHQASGAIFYLGLPVLLVLGLGIVRCLRSRRGGLVAILIGVAAVALLLSTVAVRVLHPVPLLGSFRWPFKSFFWVLLFAALAASMVLGELWNQGGRRRVFATALLALGIVGNLAAIWNDGWDRPFGPNLMQRSPEELKTFVEQHFDPQAGRVVSMWMSHGQDDIERFLTHNYATAAGAYHLGGYEPLVSAKNFELAKGLEYSNIWRYELTRESLDYLSEWSVRWLLMPDKARNEALVERFPELQIVHRDEGMLVVENTVAAPFAFLVPEAGGPPIPMPVRFGGAGLAVDLSPAEGRGGVLRIQVAAIDGYVWSADGENMVSAGEDPEEHLVLNVAPGTDAVMIHYPASGFGVGVGLAFVTALAGVWWLLRRRA